MLKRKEKTILLKIGIILSILVVLITGGIFSYLIDYKHESIGVVIGDFTIKIEEEKYEEYLKDKKGTLVDSTDDHYVYSNEIIPKDPKVVADLKNISAYVFIEVSVEKGDFLKYDENGNFIELNSKDFITYDVNNNWKLIKITESYDGFEKRIYAYTGSDGNLKALTSENNETNTLFDEIKIANYSRVYGTGSIAENLNLQVKAYGIQTDLIKSNGVEITNMEDIFNIIKMQEETTPSS